MKIAIIDYGMGNLGSVSRALAVLGADYVIAPTPEDARQVDRLILPGVGAFGDGMRHLEERGWPDAIRGMVSSGKPILGICLGMHLLADHGTEGGDTPGIGLIRGTVRRIDHLGCTQRIPHVGWNSVRFTDRNAKLLANIPSGVDFYFVHSYGFAEMRDQDILGVADYSAPIPAIIGDGRVFGTQFHPEKSSRDGLALLRNFLGPSLC